MSPSRHPRKDAADNRAALLESARSLLSRDPSASLDAIASEAGLSRRAMYGHFEGRDALLEELARQGAERVVAVVAAVQAADPVERLARIAAAAWDDIENVRALALQTVRSPRMAIVEESLEPLRARLTETLEEGALDGRLRSDVPADRLARLLIDSVLGVFAETLSAGLARAEGRRLVVSMGLSVAGLGWRDIEAFHGEHPEVTA